LGLAPEGKSAKVWVYLVADTINCGSNTYCNYYVQVFLILISVLLIWALLFFIFSYFSLLLLRGSPKEYSKVLIESLDLKSISKLAALEVLLLMAMTESVSKPRKLKNKFTQKNFHFEIYNEIVKVIAKRCRLPRHIIISHFTKFSGSIYVNRLTKYCRNSLPRNTSSDFKEFDEKENRKINEYIENRKEHLHRLVNTKVDIGDLDSIFQQRSMTAALLMFIDFIDAQSLNIRTKNDVKLIRDLQLSYWNGSLWESLLAFACLDIVERRTENYQEKINRLNFLLAGIDESSEFDINKIKGSFSNWALEVNDHIREQRHELIGKFDRILSVYKGKNALLVTYDHSRTVRALVKKNLSKSKYSNFGVFTLFGQDSGINFGTKLLYHQFSHEQYENIDKGDALVGRVRCGNIHRLANVANQFDNVIYLLSAEEWKDPLSPYLKFCKNDVYTPETSNEKYVLVSLSHKENLYRMVGRLKKSGKLNRIAPDLRQRLEAAIDKYKKEPLSLTPWKNYELLLPDEKN